MGSRERREELRDCKVSRRQFRTAVEDMTSSWLWELANQAQHRVPDPVDYIEMRRHTFGSAVPKTNRPKWDHSTTRRSGGGKKLAKKSKKKR